jgi:hypothetical protein
LYWALILEVLVRFIVSSGMEDEEDASQWDDAASNKDGFTCEDQRLVSEVEHEVYFQTVFQSFCLI